MQKDMKRLIAYSSVSHMGFVTHGLFTLNQNGIEGGILQMINHGVITGALFLCVGMIYERTHSRMIEDYGGLSKTVPVFIVFFSIFTFQAEFKCYFHSQSSHVAFPVGSTVQS